MSDDTTRRGRTTFTAALLFVVALVCAAPLPAQVPPCGDGTLDLGEECDEGPATGAPDSCCAIDCTFRLVGTPCRNTTGECDPADVCSGTSGSCVDVKRNDVCRPAAGVCDVSESCDGSASDCPADAKSSAECRAAAGVCDTAEVCNGTANDCPTDDFEPTSVACRSSAGVCDVAENCTGASAACPADDFAASTTECRASAGVCDVAENCTGSSAACPSDGFTASTTECRASAGVCDVAENCTGSSAACPSDGFTASTTECRASAGVCDVAENCTGSSAGCPADDFAASTTECRASAGVCDVAENCTGASAGCPADGFAASTTECRASAGVCDAAEHCTGAGAACPADGFAASTTECRASAGVCDAAEHCTGAGAACPADGFVASTTECRPAAGQCDVAEQCTGTQAACPADSAQPDDTPCDDANVCSINDRCVSGTCGGFLENCGNGVLDGLCAEQCDDGNLDPGDGCDESCHHEPCRSVPLSGCRAPTVAAKAPVVIVIRENPDKNQLKWKYGPGPATTKAEFGNPLGSTSYQFCIWDEVGGTPSLRTSYHIPAGGLCLGRPCWKESNGGFKFADRAASSNGISGLTFKQGLLAGKTKIQVQGKGATLPVPTLPFAQSANVVMQIISDTGVCWETRYATPADRNQLDQFRDK